MAAQERGSLGLAAEQSLYNLMERTVELEVLPACRHHGLGFVCWSPLNRGLLGGVLRSESKGRRSRPEDQGKIDRFRSQLEQYEAFCRELGAEPAAVALAWPRQNPVVTAPITGPRTVAARGARQPHARPVARNDEAARRDLAGTWRRSSEGLCMVENAALPRESMTRV